MKKILKMLFAVVLAFGFAACETYKADDPEMTAVADLDGQWICFAYDASDLTTPVTVFDILVTNTTNNDADAMWMTLTDCKIEHYTTNTQDQISAIFLDALQFRLSCNTKDLTFSCSESDASQPQFCNNIYLGMTYYTAGYSGYVDRDGYKVTVTGGKVVKNGVVTKTGYKAVAIEFTYSRTNPDATMKEYVDKGMKNTGWNEDMQDYSDFIDNNLWP